VTFWGEEKFYFLWLYLWGAKDKRMGKNQKDFSSEADSIPRKSHFGVSFSDT
jgi:hypothetical protein